MNIKNVKIFVEVLEDGTQHEEVRKTIADLRKFDEYFMIAMNNPSLDITQDLSKKESEMSSIIMHFYTFICNICFTSADIRDKISAQFDFIMNKVNKFMSKFDFNSLVCTSVFECVLSLLINLSCNLEFREKLKKSEVFAKFLITDIINKISSTGKFEKYDELYEKSLSLLYNMTIKDDLNLYYIKLDLARVLIRYFNLNFKTLEERIVDKKKSLSVVRTVSMISKLSKADFMDFISNDEFLKNVFEMIDVKILRKNTEVLEESLKYIIILILINLY